MTATILLTEEQAAARLLVSPRTLRELRQRGEIRYVALTARKIAYRPEDCDEYVAARVRLAPPIPNAGPKPKRGRGSARRPGSGVVVPFSQRKAAR